MLIVTCIGALQTNFRSDQIIPKNFTLLRNKMKKLITFWILIQAALTNKVEGVAPAVAAALASEGAKMVAPLTDTSMKRIHGSLFGEGRATRSTDVIIFNKSKHNFRLAENHCNRGGFTKDMFPEPELRAHTATVYGVESHGFMTGVQCALTYQSADGARFYVFTENPYAGHNKARMNSSPNLRVFITKGQGNNNQVRYIVENK